MLTHTNVSLMMMMMMIVAVVVVMIMMMIYVNDGDDYDDDNDDDVDRLLECGSGADKEHLRVADPSSGAALFFVCPSCTALQPVYLSALGFSRSGSAKCLFTVALSAHSV